MKTNGKTTVLNIAGPSLLLALIALSACERSKQTPQVKLRIAINKTHNCRNNPDAVKAYLRAHLQAVKWIEQNEARARSILVKRLGLTQDIGQKLRLPLWQADLYIDQSILDNMQQVLVKVGMLDAPIPANRLYDETLLNEVLAEKR